MSGLTILLGVTLAVMVIGYRGLNDGAEGVVDLLADLIRWVPFFAGLYVLSAYDVLDGQPWHVNGAAGIVLASLLIERRP